jgi:hypothetical protein
MLSSANDAEMGRPRSASRDSLSHLEPGMRAWGGIEVTDAAAAHRSGFLRYRLEMFAPGTNESERRDLLVFRRVRVWGAIAALVLVMIVGAVLPGPVGLVVVVVGYLFAVGYWLRRTSRLRQSIRRTSIAVVLRSEPRDVIGDFDLFAKCASALRELDVLSATGAVNPVAYELSWSRVYSLLEPRENPAHA